MTIPSTKSTQTPDGVHTTTSNNKKDSSNNSDNNNNDYGIEINNDGDITASSPVPESSLISPPSLTNNAITTTTFSHQESPSPHQQQQHETQSTSTRTRTTTTQRRRKKEYAVSTRWERQVADHGPIHDFHYYTCCCARRLGNMFVLCERPDGSPVVVAGPCWPFCMFVTLPLILAVSGAVSYFIIISDDSPLPIWVAYIYFPVLGFVLASLFCVSCQDPGLMERVTDEEAGEGGWFWNEQVGSFRPPGALYCRECGVLIQDYDHLCPWTGTGIGKRNMMAFKLFVVGANVLCYFSIILVIVALLRGLRA